MSNLVILICCLGRRREEFQDFTSGSAESVITVNLFTWRVEIT